MQKIKLCPNRGVCCPEVIIDGDEARIQDDYGNQIIMTKEQLNELKDKIEMGEFL